MLLDESPCLVVGTIRPVSWETSPSGSQFERLVRVPSVVVKGRIGGEISEHRRVWVVLVSMIKRSDNS